AGGSSAASPATPVRTGTVSIRDRTFEMVGELRYRKLVKIYARIAGQVVKLRFRVGEVIGAGELLAEIDPAEAEASVVEARAALLTAQLKLKAMEAGGRPEERAKAEADVKAAEAVVKEDTQKLDRMKVLFKSGGISSEELAAATRSRDVDTYRLLSARKSLELIQKGAREAEKQIASAEIQRSRAQLKLAESRLAATRITAPFTGLVQEKHTDEGAFVMGAASPSSSAICSLAEAHTMKAVVELPERMLPFIRRGQEVGLTTMAYNGEVFPGKVAFVLPAVDFQTHRSKLEIEVPNPGLRLLSGMFVKARLTAASTAISSLADLLDRSQGTTTETTK
ncbi:MAG: efflux RND transporter periplasmic adaptor subunit, partial [Candidatus Riflebacteria bacterium]|nr:efflux RND transporter periplasmic adaptor subunit [Candidatus Riflebacteria bacterium]